jgi:hypothetical protein
VLEGCIEWSGIWQNDRLKKEREGRGLSKLICVGMDDDDDDDIDGDIDDGLFGAAKNGLDFVGDREEDWQPGKRRKNIWG